MKHTLITPFLLLAGVLLTGCFITSFLLLASVLLTGCSESEMDSGKLPEGPKTGLAINARLTGGKGSATRATGDKFASALEEKRIDRLAFFVHTDEDGFQVYPPVPDADAAGDKDAVRTQYPNHVYLSGTPDLGYTAQVSLTAGGGYTADIIAIANLPEDYDYNQILTWKGLCDSVAILSATMPACLPGSAETDLAKRNALVMYGNCVKELIKEETNPVSFDMERLVARIDITNEAYAAGATPTNHGTDVLGQNGFLLTSVRLLRAQPAAYLIPKVETPDVETLSTWAPLATPGTDILYGKATTQDATANPTREPDEVAEADATTATLQYAWHTLYTNPNADTDHAPTALEIKGWYRGTEVTRQIAFADKDKNPFPILGNHRYLVRIAKAPGQTDLSYTIDVTEWDAVDTVNVKPDQTEVPVIAVLPATTMTPNVTDPSIKMYDLPYTANGTLSFDATCAFAADVRVKYEVNGKWQTQSPYEADWISVTKGDPELVPVTKAATAYKRHFEVSFKPFGTGLTRKVMLLVHNGGSEVECDTVYLRHVLTYPGTDFEPVLYKGIIWAPVNAGATAIPTQITSGMSTEDIVKYCGYLYQWGRKTPFNYNGYPGDLAPNGTFPTYAEATTAGYTYADKFIKGNSTRNYSWFSDYSSSNLSPALTVGDNAWPRDQQPCPAGWRVPTKAELDPIINEANGSNKMDNTNKIWKAAENNQFVLPAAGYRAGSGGSSNLASEGDYWSSTLNATGKSPILSFNSGRANTSENYLSIAFSIRCVQDNNP